MIGRTLCHYKILSPLGRGGMGEVFLAQDTKLDRKVALKVLPPEMASDPDRLERFSREARAVAALNHPNIVTIFSVEESAGTHFITMELVEGEPLQASVREGGLSLERLLDIALPLADALSTAHQKGITHRDLKPGNILITPGGSVKVLDFGLAKMGPAGMEGISETQVPTYALTEEGRILGTVSYMSPEQAEGKPVDPRSDVFSMGIILYEMATGRRPFQGDSSLSILSAILRETPSPASDLNPRVPRDLVRIIKRCLAKKPIERYQSALGLKNELLLLKQEVESGELSLPDAPRPATPPVKNRGMIYGLAMVTIVALAVVAIFGIWSDRSRDEASTATPPSPALPAPGSRAAPPAPAQTRIVVLPFENLGAAEDEYFAAGMTEEITSRLSAVNDLGVISRTSAVQYERTGKTVQQIGADLGVDFVLEGSVRWAKASGGSNRIRVTPQLIRVADDTHLWSDRYDRVMEDVFDLQSEIAGAVVEELGVALLKGEQQALDVKPTKNLDAYQAYLRGKKLMADPGRSFDLWTQAVREFEKAVELDPDFALAWAQLSAVHSRLYHFRVDLNEARLDHARAAADRALKLQPDLPEGRLALGLYYYWGRKDYDRALQELLPLLEERPNDAEVLQAVAYIQRRQGNWEDAMGNLERASRLSPRDLILLDAMSETYDFLRRYDEADSILERILTIDPRLERPYFMKANVAFHRTGDAREARRSLDQPFLRETPDYAYQMAFFDLMEGNFQGALAGMEILKKEAIDEQGEYTPNPLILGLIRFVQGELDGARPYCEAAEKILDDKIDENPRDPRYRAALGKVHACLGNGDKAIREATLATDLYPVSRDTFGGLSFEEDLALVYVWVGEKELALDKIDWLLAQPGGWDFWYVKKSPEFASLRDHPRFRQILEKHAPS